MRLGNLDETQIRDLANGYNARGLVTLTGVDLPPSFRPSVSDIAFVRNESAGLDEVFIDSNIRYEGSDAEWRRALTRPAEDGGRQVLEMRGGLVAALDELGRRLQEAGPPARVPAPNARAHAVPDGRGTSEQVIEDRSRRRGADRGGRHGVPLRNLVREAREGDSGFVGRAELLESMKTTLCRESKSSVVLQGEPGVGKTTLVEMLAYDIAHDRDVPAALRDAPVYDLPLGTFAENAGVVGEIERQIEELVEMPGQPVFFMDEIHQLNRPLLKPICDLLKPALARGAIRVIGATTDIEWRQFKDDAFRRRFTELRGEEPTPEQTSRMLDARKRSLEAHHDITISDEIAREAIMLAERYVPMRFFPDKAIDILDLAASMQSAAQAGHADTSPAQSACLEREYLFKAASAQSNLSTEFLDQKRSAELVDRFTDTATARLHGQSGALSSVAETLRVRLANAFTGWGRAVQTLKPAWDRRPLATFLACGPTGVGKTETARLLADALFDGRIIVLNGNDVGPEAPHATATWVGSPPGFVNSGEGGVLTNGLREHRSAVILVDEIEKACPEAIQNVLMPLMGEGCVVDRNNGLRLWATHCVVFCTSNIRVSLEKQRSLGFAPRADDDADDGQAKAFDSLVKYMRSETIARFNDILLYQDLDRETEWAVWSDLVQELQAMIGPDTEIALDESAKEFVNKRLDANRTGARGIRDLFERSVKLAVIGARAGDHVRLTVDGDCIVKSAEH